MGYIFAFAPSLCVDFMVCPIVVMVPEVISHAVQDAHAGGRSGQNVCTTSTSTHYAQYQSVSHAVPLSNYLKFSSVVSTKLF